jgi:broad specificity phosphatase PhoE
MKIFFVRHGQTVANIENTEYTNNDELHPLTAHGKLQATYAGKYLKQYGKFDLIISSPRLRAIQTAEQISKEIKYEKDIIINNLITEDISPTLSGKKKSEIFKILMKNKKFSQIFNEIPNLDPFKQIKSEMKLDKIAHKILGISSIDEINNNLTKFLNQLKKLNKKCICVVSHGGIIALLENLITNTFSNTRICLKYNKDCNDITKYGNGNTKIMACLLEENKFKLIIPSNTYHLEKLDNKK